MDTHRAGPFLDFRWGVERETHRVTLGGDLSRRPHPARLGEGFTRDFAECMLEIVTAPETSPAAASAALDGLTRRAREAVAPERLWPFSMPPRLGDVAGIPVADLDPASVLYREGLALRYGKARQMICGVHVNVSFGGDMARWLAGAVPLEAGEDGFALRLARNLYQDLPHLTLLFGASPVEAQASRPVLSRRGGPSGYAGAGFLPFLDLASTRAYGEGIRRGLRTPSPLFGGLGPGPGGRKVQRNGNVFQTEKEFYAPIRLRGAARPGETGLQALARRGPEYLELRFLDVDPFHPSGLSLSSLRLLHLFVLDGLSRPTAPRGRDLLVEDLRLSAEAASLDPLGVPGDPRLAMLERRLAGLEPWARRLDGLEGGDAHLLALESFRRQAADPIALPSARLARLFLDSGLDWTTFGMRAAERQLQGAGHDLDHPRI